jgi:hypothetical protein
MRLTRVRGVPRAREALGCGALVGGHLTRNDTARSARVQNYFR